MNELRACEELGKETRNRNTVKQFDFDTLPPTKACRSRAQNTVRKVTNLTTYLEMKMWDISQYRKTACQSSDSDKFWLSHAKN
jgi:hypothetical protein